MHSDLLLENMKKGKFVKIFFSSFVRKALHKFQNLLLTCSSLLALFFRQETNLNLSECAYQ